MIVERLKLCEWPFFVKEKEAVAAPCQTHIAFAGQRESLTTALKQSLRSSPSIVPFLQSEKLSSIVPSLNLPDFEQEFTNAVSDIKSNIDKKIFI